MRSAAGRARHREPGASRVHRRRVGRARSRFPQRALGRAAARGDSRWPDQGPALLCFNPAVSLPDGDFIREALEKLEFYVVIDFFMSRDGALRRHRAARLADGGGRRDDDQRRGARDPPPAGRHAARRARARTGGSSATSRGGSGRRQVRLQSTRDIFEELRVASKGGVADYSGITWERIDAEDGVFWPCPSLDHPGTPRLYEGWQFGHPDGKAHFQPADWRPAAEEPDAEYPDRADDRARGVAVPVGHADAPHRRARRPVSAAAVRDPSAPGRELGIADGDFVRVESRRGASSSARRS